MNRIIAIACGLVLLGGPSAWGVSLQWTRQLGTSSDDAGFGVSVSADGLGNVYISGSTSGSLGGTSAGGYDAFVTKYNAAGTLQWTRQLGTIEDEYCFGVSADGLGNVYISGQTQGSLGGTNAGLEDKFVTKYDAAGTLQWTRQWGTSSTDGGGSVSADGLGNVYISGGTNGSLGGTSAGGYDAFVTKYNAAGTLQWTRQFGTSSDDGSTGVSADGLRNVYISGGTNGNLGEPNAGGQDVFVVKYNAASTGQWARQLGTSSDERIRGVSADGLGNVYISGQTLGSLGGPNAGYDDAFVSKYDAAGNLQWTRQLGTSGGDYGYGVSPDGLGNVYISGQTQGSQGGTTAGDSDAFVAKYDAAGNLQWTKQLGTSALDQSNGVSADRLGNFYISGRTDGSLGGTNAGGQDAFVAKFSDLLIPGDYNHNGIVDAADYTVWRDSLGSTGSGLAADGDGNGVVNTLDYDFWKSHFGTHAGSGAGDFGELSRVGAAGVPEPSTIVLIGVAGAMFGLSRRRKQRDGGSRGTPQATWPIFVALQAR